MKPIEAYSRYVLGKLSSDSIVTAADSWLASELYSESLGELSCVANPIMSDVGPLFETAMHELNIGKPTREEAAKLLIKNTLMGIVAGEVDPIEGASFLYEDVHDELTDELPDKEYLGDNLGLEGIFCWLREIWDCRDGSMLLYYTNLPRHEAELKFIEHLVEESREWLEKT